jgi:hypothetical protein
MTTERKPHVHAEVIKAWADGAEVQHWSESREEWLDNTAPAWYPTVKYRIKPQPKPEPVTWYQVVYLYKHEDRPCATSDLYSSEADFRAVFRGREYSILKLIPIYTEGEETK